MISILFLGFFLGMQHALEADHVAAVASIATKQKTARRIIAHGAVWGLGHTITLMALAGGCFYLGKSIEADIARWLEAGVGVMLLALGGSVLWRLWRERVHFHVHRHTDGIAHFHAHSHEPKVPHTPRAHDHKHVRTIPYRTVLIGMMHGMAGSAALLVLTASTVIDPDFALFYIALFGIGSMMGMAALSAVIAVPLVYSSKVLTWSQNLLQGGIGGVTVLLGVVTLSHSF